MVQLNATSGLDMPWLILEILTLMTLKVWLHLCISVSTNQYTIFDGCSPHVDVAISAPFGDGPGRVFIYHGSSTEILSSTPAQVYEQVM